MWIWRDGALGGCAHALDAGLVADVEVEGGDVAAESGDLVGEGLDVGAAAAGEDEVGTGAGEGAGEVLAEAAAGAGDESDLAGEVEEVFAHRVDPAEGAKPPSGDGWRGSRTIFMRLGSRA